MPFGVSGVCLLDRRGDATERKKDKELRGHIHNTSFSPYFTIGPNKLVCSSPASISSLVSCNTSLLDAFLSHEDNKGLGLE